MVRTAHLLGPSASLLGAPVAPDGTAWTTQEGLDMESYDVGDRTVALLALGTVTAPMPCPHTPRSARDPGRPGASVVDGEVVGVREAIATELTRRAPFSATVDAMKAEVGALVMPQHTTVRGV